jgi:hypothetical protein
MKNKFLTLLIIGILAPCTAFARGVITLTSEGSLNPNQNVTVRAASSFIDLGGALIIWSVNGQLVGEGVGLTSQSIPLGALGVPVNVTAAITLNNRAYKEQLTLSPAVIDVIWEAQTSVPPFFHGKALPSHESIVRTYAIPFFGTSTTGIPEFDWKKDNTITLAKGVNRSSAQFLGAWEKTATPIKVEAKLGDVTVSDNVRITSFIPSALFYEISPLEGIRTQSALGGLVKNNGVEFSLLAVPYGIAMSERDRGEVQYNWEAGGKNIQEGLGRAFERVTLSRSEDKNTSGKISINYAAQNTVNVMQLAKGAFAWVFSEN